MNFFRAEAMSYSFLCLRLCGPEQRSYSLLYFLKIFICWFLERERWGERNIDLLFHFFVDSLIDSCLCPDRGWNPWPSCSGMTVLTNWATGARAIHSFLHWMSESVGELTVAFQESLYWARVCLFVFLFQFPDTCRLCFVCLFFSMVKEHFKKNSLLSFQNSVIPWEVKIIFGVLCLDITIICVW